MMDYALLDDKYGFGEGSIGTARKAIGDYRRPRLRLFNILDGQYIINRLLRSSDRSVEDLLAQPGDGAIDIIFSCAYSDGADFWGRFIHLETDSSSVCGLVEHLGWAHTERLDVLQAEHYDALTRPVLDVLPGMRHYRHVGMSLTGERIYSDQPCPEPDCPRDNAALHTSVVSADKCTHPVDKRQVRLALNLADFKYSRRHPANRTWIEVIAHSRD